MYEAAGGFDGWVRLAHAWYERVLADASWWSNAFHGGVRRTRWSVLAAYRAEGARRAGAVHAAVTATRRSVKCGCAQRHTASTRRWTGAPWRASDEGTLTDVGIADDPLRCVAYDRFARVIDDHDGSAVTTLLVDASPGRHPSCAAVGVIGTVCLVTEDRCGGSAHAVNRA